MSTSRRDFLKTTIVAGAGIATLPGKLSALQTAPDAPGALPPGGPAATPQYTRGVGRYPGAPAENFSPHLIPESTTYRNLALLRPAYHSSSYDYNLTAQLVTDGMKHTEMPRWISASVDAMGVLPKQDREVFVDHFPTNTLELRGLNPAIQLELGGGDSVPEVDRVVVFAVVPASVDATTLSISVSISDDGREWKQVGSAANLQAISPANYPPDLVRGAQLFYPSIPLQQLCQSRHYKVQCHVAGSASGAQWQWRVGQVEFYKGEDRIQIGGPYHFTSAWMAAGLGEEWVYVDLGTRCEFDRITLYWIARAAEGSIQFSDDAEHWRDLQPLSEETGQVEEVKLEHAQQARYVRVLMTRPATPQGYILSEIEIHGRGGFVAQAKPAALPDAQGKLDLAGGAWRLQRLNLVAADGPALSKPGFKDNAWVPATVPGTVLTSYLNVEAIPDPDYGKNQLYVSDSFFYSDFWYRTEFTAPASAQNEMAWLNFEGVNWKADVFLNGEKLGRIEGGFMRGRFDVTGKLIPGSLNALAVRIEKNATPGSAKQKTFEICSKNGGALGADNPTYHSSIGWDWISTIRGRNTGIWGDVYLETTGAVTLENPYVTATLPLPATSSADLAIEVDLVNHHAKPVTGVLRGKFGPFPFEKKVTVPASSRTSVKLDRSTTPALHIQNPQLWWPTGYGDPHLYDVELSFEVKRGKADSKKFKAGIRQMTATEDDGKLRLFINGRRFIASGGNWGFGESMLRYRAREYDAAVRYHREMNFTMIRNWVGQIPDDAFYEACDRHGVVVWQDFWLANPWDGPVPDDNKLFLDNARDTILRIRNHASIGLYCGRNEGFPPPTLETGIRKLLSDLHPSIHYIGSSADEVVSGHGPYQALEPTYYFRTADSKLHSEIGMPNVPPIESVHAMMPQAAVWPQALEWGIHDFCLQGAMGGSSFRSIVNESYGGADNAEEWITLAQFVNYEGYRAMFEAQSKYRMGLLLWMSHPCWPSFVWQTYDYYFEPTSAYFACKKACEPLHIQWNRDTETIEVVNYSAGNQAGLTAQVEVLNMDGARMLVKTAALDSREDSTFSCIPMEYPTGLSSVHFLRLTLTRGNDPVSTNFYLRGLEEANYRAIRQLAKAKVEAVTRAEQQENHWILKTELHNTSAHPALMVRLKAVRERTGDRILPAIYSDNYITLMPNERRTVLTEVSHADTRGETPSIVIGGFNVS